MAFFNSPNELIRYSSALGGGIPIHGTPLARVFGERLPVCEEDEAVSPIVPESCYIPWSPTAETLAGESPCWCAASIGPIIAAASMLANQKIARNIARIRNDIRDPTNFRKC